MQSEMDPKGRRILLLPPTRRDGEAICQILIEKKIECLVCESMKAVCDEIPNGVSVVILAEEGLAASCQDFLTLIANQPVWSDLTTIILSRAGTESPNLTAILPKMGNVTVIERPVRINTFLSLVQTSLRARDRQYEVRRHLQEQKRAEEVIRQSEERLRLAVQTGKLGVWDLDLGTMEMSCSAICKANFGRRPDQSFTYDDLWASMHPNDVDRVRQSVMDCIQGRADYDIEYRNIWPDDSIHWVLVRGRLTQPIEGESPRLVGVTLDITERKLAEEQRAQLLEAERSARSEAERAGRMKDEFLATLSHELRTPLNAILGWTQILTRKKGDAEQFAEGLRAINRNARAQTQIIEDLLDMSRIISGKVRLDVQQLTLASVVQAAVDTIRPAAEAKGVRLQVVIDPTAGAINGDPNRLQQIFWNLLSNAVKFTPRDKRVQVVCKRVNSHLEVSVSDTGDGIAPEFLPYVFDRFRQANSSTTRVHGGLGLGLAIVKQLTELHGGRVTAHSEGVGKGSTFIVRIPVISVQTDSGAIEERQAIPMRDPSLPDSDDLAGVRLLVVDDEPDSRLVIKMLLEHVGAIVEQAASAREAMDMLPKSQADILISDIGMPGEDGYSLISKVRKLPANEGGSIPAIALTAYAREEDRINSLRAGFSHHLSKPVSPAELIACILSLLRNASVGSK